jgi:hypothetical protein
MALTQTWQQTALWLALDERAEKKLGAAEELVHRLRNIMPDVETVLAKGGTSTADFTLHDEEHGYRVAQWMAKLLGNDQMAALSSAELALLLLSAYLHDIGMTPAADLVRRHRQYLLFGAAGVLSSAENEKLQFWLDEHADAVVPPILKDPVDSDALDRADLLLTHYSRSRHNDWSEEWVRTNLSSPDRQLYKGFIDDLVLLCRSHHVGYDELIQDNFRPMYVQIAGRQELVHQRYLAAVLRVADILDFDPERTPEIVFRHRSISPGSTIYWYKDHEAIFVHDRTVLTFQGRPRTAVMMQALRSMADDVDRELDVCWRLEKEGRFSLLPLSNEPSGRCWPYEPQVKRDLRPFDNAFEEFEGRFRPDTRRLLDLLSGTNLYNKKLAAVRELLQNAFDAVRQRLAFQRLAQIDAGRPDNETALAIMHSVDIRMHSEGGRWKLTCADTGVGMTKEIVRRRFLATGSRPGHLEADLERRCTTRGFSSGRTGQFGIGAVSYFMLADRLRIDTRRSQDTGDDEPNSWIFETRDVDDVAELRKGSHSTPGTSVTFTLRHDVVQPSAEQWFDSLVEYLRETILKVPCRVTVRFESEPPLIAWARGWTQTADDVRKEIIASLAPYRTKGGEPPFDLLSKSRQKEIEDERSTIARLRLDLDARLRVIAEEGQLPSNAGTYRLHLPYFELDNGACTVYLHERNDGGRMLIERVGKYPFLMPTRHRMMGWYGVRIKTEGLSRLSTHDQDRAPFLDIDWESAHVANLSVNRDSLTLSKGADDAIAHVIKHSSELEIKFLEQFAASAYACFNSRFLRAPLPPGTQRYWTYWDRAQEVYELRPITYPLIDLGQVGEPEPLSLSWKGEPLYALGPFALRSARGSGSNTVTWTSQHEHPTHLTTFDYAQSQYPFMLGVWSAEGKPEYEVSFPETWRNVAAAVVHPFSGGEMSVWNSEHPAVTGTTEAAWEWAWMTLPRDPDPSPFATEILHDRARACAWLMKNVTGHLASHWDGFAERQPDLMKEIWRSIFGDDTSQILIARMVGGHLEINVITATHWRELKMPGSERSLVEEYLPEPPSTVHVDEPAVEEPNDDTEESSSAMEEKLPA